MPSEKVLGSLGNAWARSGPCKSRVRGPDPKPNPNVLVQAPILRVKYMRSDDMCIVIPFSYCLCFLNTQGVTSSPKSEASDGATEPRPSVSLSSRSPRCGARGKKGGMFNHCLCHS